MISNQKASKHIKSSNKKASKLIISSNQKANKHIRSSNQTASKHIISNQKANKHINHSIIKHANISMYTRKYTPLFNFAPLFSPSLYAGILK